MSPLSAISLSGMQAAQASLGVAAHNIANLATPGFRRELATQATVPGAGVSTTVQRASQEGNALETDVVAQLAAKNQFLANLAVFKTGDQMLGALLDVRR